MLCVEDLGSIYLVKLLMKGCYIVHGALLDANGNLIMVYGFPSSGKTTTAVTFLSKGATVYSDDISIICSNGIAYGLPPKKGLGALAEEAIGRKLIKFYNLKKVLARNFILYTVVTILEY